MTPPGVLRGFHETPQSRLIPLAQYTDRLLLRCVQ